MQDASAIATSAVNNWGNSAAYVSEGTRLLEGKDDVSLKATALALGQLAGSLTQSLAEAVGVPPSEVMQALALEWTLSQEDLEE